MIAPVGFELRGVADAFQLCDLVEDADEPGDEHGEGIAPIGSDHVIFERRSDEAHGCEYTRAGRPADLRNANPAYFAGKLLRLLGGRERQVLD